MTRQEAIDQHAAAAAAKEQAWKAVRANRTDYALDDVLRAAAFQADEACKAADSARIKFAF